MKFQLIFSIFFFIQSRADEIGPPGIRPTPPPLPPTANQKPYGAFYCQARCLASCLETFLAPNLDECQKFCPPFEGNMPCAPDNVECWQTCGTPSGVLDKPAPDSVDTASVIPDAQLSPLVRDPFLINLQWSSVPNASLYIVEFYPINRSPRPGENSYFQAMTTSLMYVVRKEDECVEYDARVIAVNSYGISNPTYAFVPAPSPLMNSGEYFTIRNLQRDPWHADMVTVTIDYTFPIGWPLNDIDIDGLRVKAVDCKGPKTDRSFGDDSVPSFNAVIGKSPTTAIQLSFFDDVLPANCMFQMRVSSLTTRCNTTTAYDEADQSQVAPGIDFRINCDSIPGACDNSTVIAQPPIPVPSTISVDSEVVVPPLSMPGFLPTGIDQPQENVSSNLDMPTPPPLPPLFPIDDGDQMPNIQPMPPGSSISVIDLSPNGTSVQNVPIIPQAVLPPLCDLEMIDVIPSLNTASESLVDLVVVWLERQTLPPPPPASYFTIRYGPTVRKLVDDERDQTEIIPGYENIERTGQQMGEMPMMPDTTRQINMSGIQRGSLMKIQICAIFDPNTEPLIQWDTVPSHRIDLAALEPFIELDNAPATPDQLNVPLSPDQMMVPPPSAPIIDGPEPTIILPVQPAVPNPDDLVDTPVIIAVNVEQSSGSTLYWISVMAGIMLMCLTATLVFVCLRRMCNSRRRMKCAQKPMFVVNTVPTPPPAFNEVVKVPLP